MFGRNSSIDAKNTTNIFHQRRNCASLSFLRTIKDDIQGLVLAII